MKTIRSGFCALILLCTALWVAGCGTENTYCSVHQNDDGTTVMTCPDGSSATLPPSSRPPLIDSGQQMDCELRDESTLQCGDIIIDLSDKNVETPTDACTLHGGTPPYLQCGDIRIPVDTPNLPNDDLAGTCSLQGKDSAGNPILKCGDEQFAIGDGTTVTPVCSGGFTGDLVIDRSDHPILDIFDASNCIVLRGNLVIEEYKNDNIPEVLRKIETVYGYISIQRTNLTSVQLPNLKRVFGRLTIQSNEKLLRAKELDQLERVEGTLHVSGNPQLVEISDFPNLSTVHNISFERLPISAFPTFPRVTEATGIYVGNLPQLVTFHSFQNLRTLDYQLDIVSNSGLTQIIPPTKLQRGRVRFWRNPMLTDIGQYPALESGGIYVNDNQSLTTLPTFPKLKTVDDIKISYNPLLISAGEYPALKEIRRELSVTDNPLITALPDLSRVTTLNGLFISQSPLLLSLGDFPHIQNISDSFTVDNNESLTTLGDFSNLEQIHGKFHLSNLENLTSLTSLSALRSIQQGFISGLDRVPYAELEAFQNQLDDPAVLTLR